MPQVPHPQEIPVFIPGQAPVPDMYGHTVPAARIHSEIGHTIPYTAADTQVSHIGASAVETPPEQPTWSELLKPVSETDLEAHGITLKPGQFVPVVRSAASGGKTEIWQVENIGWYEGQLKVVASGKPTAQGIPERIMSAGEAQRLKAAYDAQFAPDK